MPSSHAIDGVNGALLWGAQSAARFPAHDPPERHQ